MIKFVKSKKISSFLVGLVMCFSFAQAANAATYRVESGDSTYKIAQTFNMPVNQILESNNISGNTIYPGQELNIPSTVYTVKSGDSLYLISKRYATSVYSLRMANSIWTDLIYPGQKLDIVGSAIKESQSQSVAAPSRGDTQKSVVPCSAKDLDLLARLVTAEAEDQPYSAKVAVAAVVINRVQDSHFPNSIKNVIYEVSDGHYQFTPILNGYINKPASEDAKKAALEALRGNDPSNGALFYFDNSVTNKWLLSKKVSNRIDKMIFTYFN